MTPLGLLGRFLAARPLLATLAVLTAAASAAAEIAFPWLLQQGIDAALGEPTTWTLHEATLAMGGVIVVVVLGHALSLTLQGLIFATAAFGLRDRLYRVLHRLPLARLAQHRSGSLAYRATSDVAALENGLGDLFSEASFDLLVAVGVVTAMCLTEWRMTLMVMLVMLTSAVVGGRLGERLPVYKRASQMLSARLAGQLQESLSSARTIRALTAEEQMLVKLEPSNQRLRRIDVRAGLLRGLVLPLGHFTEMLGIAIVLGYGGALVSQHLLSVGTLVAFLAYMELLAGPLNRAGGYWYQWQSCRGVASRLTGLLEEVPSPSYLAPPSYATLVMEDVWFQHPGQTRWVAQGISLRIAPGEHVALLGRNGAGKSTLFDLLLGLQVPQRGRVMAEGCDLAAADLAAWRRHVGLMPQETVLLHGSLADNLALAKPDATFAEMRQALSEAGGAALLARLPQGLDTLVGERGTGLSGGERQVVGLARLVLRTPMVVLLDEPTAHLDGEALRVMSEALARFCTGRTMVLITHNQDLLTLVTRCVVLDEGRVVADGSPATLRLEVPQYGQLLGAA